MKTKQIVAVALAIVIVGAAAWFTSLSNRASSEVVPPEPRTSSSSAARESAGAAVTLAVDGATSLARYRVREQLAGFSFPNDAVGTTRTVSGMVALDANGKVLSDRSAITVNLTRLQSDQSRRDNFVRMNTLETNRYPEAHFVPTEIRGLPATLPTEGEASIAIVGELTVKNVTRSVEWTGTATFSPEGMNVTAGTVITFEQFGISKPRVASVLSVADEIRLEVEMRFLKQS